MIVLRRLVALLVVLLAAAPALAQTIPSSTFSALPGSAAGGTLRWVTDGGCTPIPGTPEIGGGVHKDLVSFDAVDARWEFVQRAPLGTTDSELPTFLNGDRIAYDNAASGAVADDVQEALDELFAEGGGGPGNTDLSQGTRTTNTVTIDSSTGAAAVLSSATSSLAGVMASTDKAKLDAIASGATVGLGANPSPCPAGQFVTDQDQSGVLTCAVDDDVPEATDFGASPVLDGAGALEANSVPLAAMQDDSVGIAELSATGAPSGTTFLRGDNTWAVPAGGGGGLANVFADPAPAVSANLTMNRHDLVDLYAIGAAIYYCSTEEECEEAEQRCGDTIGGLTPTGCIVQHTGGKLITSTGLAFAGTGASGVGNVGMIFRGAGGGNANEGEDSGTVIQMTGAAPAITFGACVGCAVEDLAIDGTGVATVGLDVLPNTGAPTKLSVHRVGIYSINGPAIRGPATGQFDQSSFSMVHVTDSLKCVELRNSQSVEIILGPNFNCTDMLGTGPYLDVQAGQFTYQDSFLKLPQNNAVGMKLGAAATAIRAYHNRFEFSPTVTGATAILADNGDVNSVTQEVIVDGNEFVIGAAGNKAVDARVLGTVSITNNRGLQGGSVTPDLTLPFEVDRNAFQATYAAALEYWGNSEIFINSVAVPYPIAWEPTIGSGVSVFRPVSSSAALPSTCVDGALAFLTTAASGRRLHGCEAGAWVLQGDGGGAFDLGTLTDVTITTPATGATLVKSGTDWIDGALDLADPDAVTGVLGDANVSDAITAANYMPTAGGSFTGPVALLVGASLTVSNSSSIFPLAGGVVQANQFTGSGSTSSAVDLPTAEVSGLLGVANGGLGIASPTSGGILLGTGPLAVHATPVLAAGQLLIGDGTTDPTIAAMSGDVTMTSGGVTSLATGSVAANEIVSTGVSAGTYSAPTITVDGDGRITAATQGTNLLIASGSRALATAAIASGACSSADVGITATGVASTDVISWTPNADISTVVGYRPLSSDGLAIYPYPSTNGINFKVCNPTASSITPGAVTLNWRVTR